MAQSELTSHCSRFAPLWIIWGYFLACLKYCSRSEDAGSRQEQYAVCSYWRIRGKQGAGRMPFFCGREQGEEAKARDGAEEKKGKGAGRLKDLEESREQRAESRRYKLEERAGRL